MDKTEFLQAIFQDSINNENKLSIWGPKHHRFCTDIPTAVEYTESLPQDNDIYFGLGLVGGTPKGRGKLEDITAIGCLWADIDIKCDAHKKTNLPMTQKDAELILTKVHLPPSIIVHTGHGLQAFWCFTEPWVFDSDTERDQAGSLARRWINTIRAHATPLDIDPVGDLTRVFRIPGTMNCKATPVPVEIQQVNKNTYQPDDFDIYLVADEMIESNVPDSVVVGILNLNLQAEPPSTKLMVLLENDTTFKRTWKYNRKDFTDNSPSSYDMSLVNISSRAGWSDQEIANLIIAFRRQHNLDPQKGLRLDYVQRTIAKARRDFNYEQVQNNVLGDAAAPIVPGVTTDEKEKERIINQLSTLLKLPILRWVQIGTENAWYRIDLHGEGDPNILIGVVSNLFRQNIFRQIIYEYTSDIIPTFKPAQWQKLIKLLGKIVDRVERDCDNRLEILRDSLQKYIERKPPLPLEPNSIDIIEAIRSGQPLQDDDYFYINAADYQLYRSQNYEAPLRITNLTEQMDKLGMLAKTIDKQYDKQRMARRYWYLSRKQRNIEQS